MNWYFTNLIAAFLLPPLNLLLLLLLSLILWKRMPRIAFALTSAGTMLLWLLSTPYFSASMLHLLESTAPPLNRQSPSADAIVVLGGGTYYQAPEYGGDTVSTRSLLRLRYAAKLYRELNKPILLSGGAPQGNLSSEAQQMKSVLEDEFKTPVRWLEEKSNNTLESARNSYQLLQQSSTKNIYLVTHAWHMPRSVMAFQAAGFQVTPAPTAFNTRHDISLLSFIPDASALEESQIVIHEIIGILWYRLKS